jgi:hypothetical protein
LSINIPKKAHITEAAEKFRKNIVGVKISAIKNSRPTIKNTSQVAIVLSLYKLLHFDVILKF